MGGLFFLQGLSIDSLDKLGKLYFRMDMPQKGTFVGHTRGYRPNPEEDGPIHYVSRSKVPPRHVPREQFEWTFSYHNSRGDHVGGSTRVATSYCDDEGNKPDIPRALLDVYYEPEVPAKLVSKFFSSPRDGYGEEYEVGEEVPIPDMTAE